MSPCKKKKEPGCNMNFFGGSDMPTVERYEHAGGLIERRVSRRTFGLYTH